MSVSAKQGYSKHKCHRNDFSIKKLSAFAARSMYNAYFSLVSFLLHMPCMMSVTRPKQKRQRIDLYQIAGNS